MKRPMTLTAGILATVMHSVYTIFELIVFAALIDAVAGAGSGAATVVVIMGLTLALSVVSIVFNAIAITAWNKDAERFIKKRGMVITAIVFNFIVALFIIIGMIAYAAVGVVDVLLLLVCIASNVLYIVDLCLEKKRVAKLAGETVATEEVAETQVEASDVEAKIEKLNKMKEQGMISEEEYEELKKGYINAELNK